MSPDCLLGVVPQPTDSRLSETNARPATPRPSTGESQSRRMRVECSDLYHQRTRFRCSATQQRPFFYGFLLQFFEPVAQLTGRLPKFYFTSARLNCIPQNRQCHQIMTFYFSSSRIYRSFIGKRQHFEIRNAGDLIELGVELHFLYCSISCTVPFPPVEPPTAVFRTKTYQPPSIGRVSLARENEAVAVGGRRSIFSIVTYRTSF